MNEFITEKGTKLFYEVDYSLGGYNYFTGEDIPRGYSLSVNRSKHEMSAFTGLESPTGAISLFLHEVTRQSKKGLATAEAMATPEKLQEIANRYGI